MDTEKELLESLEFVGEIEREILGNKITIDAYISKLETDIRKLAAEKNVNFADRSYRVDLVSKLCALSELYSVIDFDKMIEAREIFIDMLPDHFTSYLNYLETATVSSTLLYGCLGCKSYKGSCELGAEPPNESHGERCSSRTAYVTC